MTITQYTEYDTENNQYWTSIQYTLDDGVITNTLTITDIGNEEFGTYENGVLVYATSINVSEFRHWNTIEIWFAGPDQLDEARITYDNGTVHHIHYENGLQQLLIQEDNPNGSGNAEPWERIETTYDENEQITERFTLNDDGTESYETFENRQLVSLIQYDNPNGTGNAETWERIETTYEANGQIAERATFNDDGTISYETFEDGQLASMRQYDSLYGETNAEPWEFIETTYDENGQIAERQTYYDDGTQQFEAFEDGQRVSVRQFDNPYGEGNAASWDSIETTYDENGQIAERSTLYDNGLAKHEVYIAGLRVQTTQIDNFGAAGDGVKAWDRIETTYDENGQLAERTTVFDNGVLKTETFEDGQRGTTVMLDIDDAKNWDSVTTLRENGVVTQQTTLKDNGDISVALYTDGSRSQKLDYDGDDSAPWVLQVTNFAEDGGREVTRYMSVDDIPETYLSYFPELDTGTEQVLDFNDRRSIHDGDTVLDGALTVDVSQGQYNIQGIVTPYEYGGETPDSDFEAFNSWGATIGFTAQGEDAFDFSSLSVANSSRADTTNVPESNWANAITINGYNDGDLVQSIELDLTFEHTTYDLGWEDLDRIEFVASGGGITNDHVENAGWFSIDDLVFVA